MKCVRLFTCFIIVLLISTMDMCFAANDTIMYNAAMAKLLQYKNEESVNEAIDGFSAITSDFGQSPLLLAYAKAIKDIYAGNYETAQTMLTRLQADEEFTKLLSENNLPACSKLAIYAQARGLESQGQYSAAAYLYNDILEIWDAFTRSMDMEDKGFEQKDADYQQALVYMTQGKYKEAAEIFTNLGNYKDSETQLQKAIAALATPTPSPVVTPTPSPEPVQETPTVSLPTISDIPFPVLSKGDRSSRVRYLQNRLIELGYLQDKCDGVFGSKTEAALQAFQQVVGLNTSGVTDNLTAQLLYSYDAPKANTAPEIKHITDSLKAGDSVAFGKLEQDGNETNGYEDIIWYVMRIEGGNALLISKYILFEYPMSLNDSAQLTTWETCSIRQVLNEDFYYSVFSASERPSIVQTHIENRRNSQYGTESGSDTNDYVFLLSTDEANELNNLSSEMFVAFPTVSAMANYQYRSGDLSSNGTSWYWDLRTTGQSENLHAIVTSPSNNDLPMIDYVGKEWRFMGDIRPALWVSCS